MPPCKRQSESQTGGRWAVDCLSHMWAPADRQPLSLPTQLGPIRNPARGGADGAHLITFTPVSGETQLQFAPVSAGEQGRI